MALSEWTDPDGRVRVVEVMARLRERLRGRRDLGLYSDDEVDELAAVKLQEMLENAHIDPELLTRLMAPDHNWNISANYSVRSHRQGAVARVVILAKHLVRPFVRLYTDHVVGRQAQINLYLYYVCKSLLSEVVRLQLESAALRNRLENLERGLGPAVAGSAGPGATLTAPEPGALTQISARAERSAEAGAKTATDSESKAKGQAT
jgi:hypothetical protein